MLGWETGRDSEPAFMDMCLGRFSAFFSLAQIPGSTSRVSCSIHVKPAICLGIGSWAEPEIALGSSATHPCDCFSCQGSWLQLAAAS